MPFKGQLQRGVPFTIDYASGFGSSTNQCGLTIIKINQRGGMHATSLTANAGVSVTVNEILGPRIVRMIVQIRLDPGALLSIVFTQGSATFTDDFLAEDTDLVFDAVP